MELVLAFAGIVGGVLFLTHSLSAQGTSFGDVLKGHATLATGSGDSDLAAAEAATVGGGANVSASMDQRVAAANAAAGSGRLPAKVSRLLSAYASVVGAPYSQANHSAVFGKSAAVVKKLGTDCSGLVSWGLGQAGIISAPQTTQTLPDTQGISAGPGKYVTMYDRDDGPIGNEHVIIDVAGHWFESGGGAASGGNGGVAAIAQPSQGYLSTFNQLLHPTGL